jgi:hypothetical protein
MRAEGARQFEEFLAEQRERQTAEAETENRKQKRRRKQKDRSRISVARRKGLAGRFAPLRRPPGCEVALAVLGTEWRKEQRNEKV